MDWFIKAIFVMSAVNLVGTVVLFWAIWLHIVGKK